MHACEIGESGDNNGDMFRALLPWLERVHRGEELNCRPWFESSLELRFKALPIVGFKDIVAILYHGSLLATRMELLSFVQTACLDLGSSWRQRSTSDGDDVFTCRRMIIEDRICWHAREWTGVRCLTTGLWKNHEKL